MLESVQTFFAMGGYGAFVWSAYAITFIVLVANLFANGSGHKRLIARLKKERMLTNTKKTGAVATNSSVTEDNAIHGDNVSNTNKGAA